MNATRKQPKAATGKRKTRISKVAQCIRRTAATVPLKRVQMPDAPSFNPSELTVDMSGKMAALIAKIKTLDAQDKDKHGTYFKHFIFTDLREGSAGAKAIAAFLIAAGFELSMGHKGKRIKRDGVYQETKKGDTRFLEGSPVSGGSNRFAMLQSVPLWKNPLSVETKQEILSVFNARPGSKGGKPERELTPNMHGEVVRIAILDSKYKEGIDLFDVKYVHLMEPALANSDLKQAIGRATRFCGQKGLPFAPRRGWPLEVFVYTLDLPNAGSFALGDGKTVDAHDLVMAKSGLDLALLQLTSELTKLAIESSVDYALNYKINNFKIEEALLDATDIDAVVVEILSADASALVLKGGARKPKVVAIHSARDITPRLLEKCFHRKSKLFPFSRAHMETTATKLGIKHAKSAKRQKLCQLILHHPEYLKELLLTVSPLKKIESVSSLEALSAQTPRSIPKADLIKTLSAKSTTSANAGLRHLFATPPEPSLNSTTSQEGLAGSPQTIESMSSQEGLPGSPQTIESTTSQEALSGQSARSIPKGDLIKTLSAKSTTSADEAVALAGLRFLFATPPDPTPKKGVTPHLRDVSQLPFEEFQTTVTQRFANYAWDKPPVKNGCDGTGPGKGTVADFTKTQDFVQHYLTPESPFKGILLWHSVGTGKTCAAVAATGRFEAAGYRILWVTRNALLADLYKNVFGMVCSLPIREQLKDGLVLPEELSAQKRLLSSLWAPPITYRTFQNALEKKNELGHAMYRRNADPLYKTFIVLDEVHKLQDGDLSPSESASFDKIKAFLHKSYAASGADSVRILLMTATPITDTPKELFEIVNALIPKPENRLMDFAAYRAKFANNGRGMISPEGRAYYQERAKGLVSYLNREYDPSTFSIPQYHEISVRLPTVNVPTLEELTTTCLKGVPTPSPRDGADCAQIEREMETAIGAVTGKTVKERTAAAAAVRKTYKAKLKDCRAAAKKATKVDELQKAAMKCYSETKKDFTRKFKGSQQAVIEECFTTKTDDKKGDKKGDKQGDKPAPKSFFVDKGEFEAAVRQRLTRKMPVADRKQSNQKHPTKKSPAKKSPAKKSPSKKSPAKNPKAASRNSPKAASRNSPKADSSNSLRSFNSTGAVITPQKDRP